MIRTCAIGICIVFAPAPSLAQSAPKPDGQWRGSLGAGLTATSGNDNSLTYTLNGDVVRQTDSDKITGFAQAVYGRRTNGTGGVSRTADQQRAGGAYNRNFDTRAFGFGAAEFERNRLANLNLRSVVSGGIGYHVIKRAHLTFDVSTGPAYNHEELSTGSRGSIEWLFAEESTRAFTPSVSFRQRLALYPSLARSGEYRAVFDAGLVMKMSDRWNATVTLTDRFQSAPPVPGTKRNDLLLVTGLQYVFNP